jgi:hypothetical protein
MMGLETLRAVNRQATAKAAREARQPFEVTPEDIADNLSGLSIPYIGDRVPRGWRKVTEWFVDKTGFGTAGESAITLSEMRRRIVRNGPGYGYGSMEEGQFQIYVAVFVRVAR